MNREIDRGAVSDVLYLSGCALRGETPDAERMRSMDRSRAYKVANAHMLAALCGAALSSAGIKDAQFTHAVSAAVRQAALFGAAEKDVRAGLEAAGVWYLPLKGMVLREYYPKYGARQMSDCDMLYDADRAEDVRRVMERLGFHTKSFGGRTHDVYEKPPVARFEMHRALFHADRRAREAAYYRDIESRLLPEEGSRFGRRLSPEDFYLFMIAHAYKHYTTRGTGLRILTDIYACLRARGETMNWAYIEREAEALGVAAFERQVRALSRDALEDRPLNAGEEEMLSYLAGSGVYGTDERRKENRVAALGGGAKGRIRYFFTDALPPIEKLRKRHSMISKSRPLLLVYGLWRRMRRASRR